MREGRLLDASTGVGTFSMRETQKGAFDQTQVRFNSSTKSGRESS